MEADLFAPEFTDPEKAREVLESERWPDGPICPHCGLVGEAYKLLPKPGAKTHVRSGVWKCAGCREQFSVTVGTIFEDSHIPLNKWLMAIHLMCASKKGMSAHQLHRMLGIGYRAAWFMAHRIRYGMMQEPLSSKLDKLQGTVEVDETYIGGSEKGMHGKPGFTSKKATVVSMVERSLVPGKKGRVRSTVMHRVTADNLRDTLRAGIAQEAILNTDESSMYWGIGQWWKGHESVNHTRKEYVKTTKSGEKVTTNTIEGFFGILKRGIDGVYHHVGRHHLHRYLSEFDFRYNAREVSDTERAKLALKGVGGKRLKYRDSLVKER
jgi:transposase-like protein